LRIIAGKHRSRTLIEFNGIEIRPTTDRVKESLFNILQNNIPDSSVLDLFCGSGNLGLEAISRGAKTVTFVDNSKKSIEICKENLSRLKEEGNIIFSDSNKFLQRCEDKFDIIFLDPPYKSVSGIEALKIIGSKGLLNEDGIAVFESDKFIEEEISKLIKINEKKYGIVHLSFFKTQI
jgi:16S rRNA (guanine(966)-N(2))-methyltransferase RsmD